MTPPDGLDLERGGDEPEDDERESRERGDSDRSRRRRRANVQERLMAIFSRLAASLEGRGDEELAGVIREDSKTMAEALASVVRRAPGFAPPILGALAVLEPLLAFGRIFRLLLGRMRERRAEALEGFENDERELVPECGVEGCEIQTAHRHEPDGVVYF